MSENRGVTSAAERSARFAGTIVSRSFVICRVVVIYAYNGRYRPSDHEQQDSDATHQYRSSGRSTPCAGSTDLRADSPAHAFLVPEFIEILPPQLRAFDCNVAGVGSALPGDRGIRVEVVRNPEIQVPHFAEQINSEAIVLGGGVIKVQVGIGQDLRASR